MSLPKSSWRVFLVWKPLLSVTLSIGTSIKKPILLSVYQMESLISFHAFSIRIVLIRVFSFVAKSKLPRRRENLLSFCLSYVKPLVSFNRLQLLRINKNSEQKLHFVTLCTQSHTNSHITKVLLKWTGCCKIT